MLPTRNYTGIDGAITQRPVSSAILGIDSDDRFATADASRQSTKTGPYSFSINKNQSLFNGFFTRLGVTEFTMDWVIPNINEKTRAIVVTYDVGAGEVSELIVLPPGFYTPSQLASALQTEIRLLDPLLNTFTMIYGVNAVAPPAKIPIFSYATNNPAVTIGFTPLPVGTSSTVAPPVQVFTVTPTTRQLYDLLGFIASQNTTLRTVAIGGLTFAQSVRYIDVVCTQLTYNQSLKDNTSAQVNRDMLARIYINSASTPSNVDPSSATFCPPGCAPFTLYREFASPKFIQWLPNQPIGGSIQFEVYADDGTNLSEFFPSAAYNASDWAMTLLVTEN